MPRLRLLSARKGPRKETSSVALPRRDLARPRRSRVRLQCSVVLYLAAALVGASGLTYQLLAVRRFGEVLGLGAHAVAIVLSLFLLGFGVGAAWCGRLVDHGWSGRRLFLFLQAALVVYAVGFCPWMSGLEELYLRILPAEAPSPLVTAVQSLVAALGLALPSLALGGTVPALAACATSRSADVGGVLARCYAADTLGAAGGAWLTTFVLLPVGGVSACLVAAAAASLLAALLVARRGGASATRGAGEDGGQLPAEPAGVTLRVLLFAAFASGFAGLGLESLWTRALAMRLSSTVYSLALVLTAFLTALGLGSLCVSWLDRRGWVTRGTVGTALLGAGLAGLASMRLLAAIDLPAASSPSLTGLHRRELFAAFGVMLVPCLGLGATFPMLAKLAHRSMKSFGRDLGRVYLANTLGAVLAPLVVVFVLVRAVGLSMAITATAALPLVAAVAMLRLAGRAALFAAALAVIALLVLPTDLRRWRHAVGDELIDYRDGSAASVAVVRGRDGDVALYLDFAYRLGTRAASFPQRRQGVLPVLLHPDPKRALFLGAGTGTSAGAAAALGDVAVDVTEIVPEVVAMLPHFANANFGLSDRARRDPRIRILPVDARHYVRRTRHRYDVVVADVFMPWLAGEAKMYTVEHFAALRAVLERGGLVCQWLPLFQMSEQTLASVVATFCSVFPQVDAWWAYFNVETPVLGLFGSAAPRTLTRVALDRALSRAGRHNVLHAIALTEARGVASHWLMGRERLLRWAKQAPIETRARPRLEFLAPDAMLIAPYARAKACLGSLLRAAEGAAATRPLAALGSDVHGRVLAGARVMRARFAVRYAQDTATAIGELAAAIRADGEWNLAARDLELQLQAALAAKQYAALELGARAMQTSRRVRAVGHYYAARAALAKGDRRRALREARAAQRLRPSETTFRELVRTLGG